MNDFLGIGQQDSQQWFQQSNKSALTKEAIDELVAERNQARSQRDFCSH